MSDETFPVTVCMWPIGGRSKPHYYRGEIVAATWYDPDCDVAALAFDMAYSDLQETVGWPIRRSGCSVSVTMPPRPRVVVRQGQGVAGE